MSKPVIKQEPLKGLYPYDSMLPNSIMYGGDKDITESQS
jgi:hypothetical protein